MCVCESVSVPPCTDIIDVTSYLTLSSLLHILSCVQAEGDLRVSTALSIAEKNHKASLKKVEAFSFKFSLKN